LVGAHRTQNGTGASSGRMARPIVRASRKAVCATSRQPQQRRPAQAVGSEWFAQCCSRNGESDETPFHSCRLFFGLAAFGPANAQRSNPASASLSPTVTPGAATSGGQGEANPAFTPQGPCSVSPNAIGGVTTSSSCGTDPLEVPAQALSSSSSPAQVSGGTTHPAQSSSGSSSSGGSTATSNAGSAAAASNTSGGGGGAPSSGSTLCSSSVSSTSGTLGAGSLISGSGC